MTTREALRGVEIGAETVFENLAMHALLDGGAGEPGYLLLDEALAKGTARVTEAEPGGIVEELLFTNQGEQPVLLLDGEELIGAQQNRMVNLTILVPAGKAIRIPVSCVEQGRWHAVSAEFQSAPRAMFAASRAMKTEHVSASLRASGERHSDQSAVWDSIRLREDRMAAASPTHALSDIYARHSGSIEEYAAAFRPAERQVGAAFAINGKLIGLDLFDRRCTLAKLLPKLVRSYALDALDARRQETAGAARPGSLERLLRSAEGWTEERFPAPGLGEDVRISAERVAGAALEWEGRTIHLSVFRTRTPRPQSGRGHEAGIARASARLRMRQ